MASDPPDTDALYRLLDQIEKRFDALREADRKAVALAHADLSTRLEGFPQQFALKAEAEEASRSLQRLDKERLSASVFETFVDNYRRDQEITAADRRAEALRLAEVNERFHARILEERTGFMTVESYDIAHQAVVRQIDAVERWQYKLVGGLVFATFVAPVVAGTVVYFITRGAP